MKKPKEEMIDPVEVRIPFPGFYESMLSSLIEKYEEQIVERASEDNGLTEKEQKELWRTLWRHEIIDNEKAQEIITKKYAEIFIDQLKVYTGTDVRYSFSIMTSPREYNFITDQLYLFCEYEDMLAVKATVSKEALDETAHAMFTSRSGFMSFYDNEVEAWGPTDTWDHNHWYCVLEAVVVDGGRCEWSHCDWYIYSLGDGVELSECGNDENLQKAVEAVKEDTCDASTSS